MAKYNPKTQKKLFIFYASLIKNWAEQSSYLPVTSACLYDFMCSSYEFYVKCNSERIKTVIKKTVVQNQQEKEYVEKMLNPAFMIEQLNNKGNYSFIYSVYDANCEIRTKKYDCISN